MKIDVTIFYKYVNTISFHRKQLNCIFSIICLKALNRVILCTCYSSKINFIVIINAITLQKRFNSIRCLVQSDAIKSTINENDWFFRSCQRNCLNRLIFKNGLPPGDFAGVWFFWCPLFFDGKEKMVARRFDRAKCVEFEAKQFSLRNKSTLPFRWRKRYLT